MQNNTEERTQVTHKQLVELIAQHSKYHAYEVQDILHSLACCLQQQMQQGNRVKITGLGWFHAFQPKQYFKHNTLLDKHMLHVPDVTCSFKPDSYMRAYLNKGE